MAWRTLGIEPSSPAIAQELLHRHFDRKHGASAYYGQAVRATRTPRRAGDELRDRAGLRDRVGAGRPRRPGDRRGAGDRDPRVRERRDRSPAAQPRRRRHPRAGLGAPGSRRLPRHDPVDGSAAAVADRHRPRPRSIGIGIDFTACTMLPTTADGTPLCRLPEFRREPHAWVKLWKHHAAQPEADRINETAAARGESWLPRYGGRISSEWFYSKSLQILDEAPSIYRGRGPPDRGRRLGDLAADRRRDAQLVHRRLQGDLVEAGRVPVGVVLRRARRGFRVGRRRQDVARRPVDRRAGRRAVRGGGRLDRTAARDRGRDRERRRPRFRSRGRRHRARHDGRGHGHEHLPHGPRLAAGRRRRDVRRRRGRHHPGLLRLRGGPVGGRRHLRLVHEAGRPAGGPRAGAPRRRRRPRRPRARRRAASTGRKRAARPRLVERQSLDPRRRRAQRPARRGDAGDAAGRHLPGPARVDGLRDAGDHRVAGIGGRRRSTGSSRVAGCRNGTSC